MLTTRFEELKMGDDESFDSFYRKLNEIVIAKLNLREKIKDAKMVRKILRSLPESFLKENLVLYPIQNSRRKRHSWIYFIHD